MIPLDEDKFDNFATATNRDEISMNEFTLDDDDDDNNNDNSEGGGNNNNSKTNITIEGYSVGEEMSVKRALGKSVSLTSYAVDLKEASWSASDDEGLEGENKAAANKIN